MNDGVMNSEENIEEKTMHYEHLLDSVNGFRFQVIVYLLLAFTTFQSGFNLSTLILTTTDQYFNCTSFSNRTLQYNSTLTDASYEKDTRCSRGVPVQMECISWEYEKHPIAKTIVSEFNLVCRRKNLVKALRTIYYCGQIFGNILGCLGDKIGRRKFILICCLWEIVIGLLTATVPGLAALFVLTFLRGLSLFVYIQGFTLLTELIPIRSRSIFCNCYWLFWSLSYLFAALITYYSQEWRLIKLWGILPCLVYAFYFLLLPESPRWLMVNGRENEALEAIVKISRINGSPREIVENLRQRIPDKEDDGRSKAIFKTTNKQESLLNMFLYKNTRRKLIVACFMQWCLCGVYYAISTDIKFFSKNIFHSTLIQGCVELPSSILGTLFCRKFGRKLPLISMTLLATLLMPVVTFLRISEYSISQAVLALSVKLLFRTAFTVADAICSEIQPVSMRAMGLTLTNISAVSLNPFVPWINALDDNWIYLPCTIFGIQNLMSLLLIGFIIPETSKCPLVGTLAESEKLVRGKEKEFIALHNTNDRKSDLACKYNVLEENAKIT